MSYYRLSLLTSFISGIGALRRVRCWWMLDFVLITLGDFASVDVDTVGVVVGASLAFGLFSMIVVKFCSAFSCLSFSFAVCVTADFIAVRRSDAAMRVLSAS